MDTYPVIWWQSSSDTLHRFPHNSYYTTALQTPFNKPHPLPVETTPTHLLAFCFCPVKKLRKERGTVGFTSLLLMVMQRSLVRQAGWEQFSNCRQSMTI